MDPGNSCYDSESMAPLIRSTTSEGVSAETQLHDLGYEQELPRTLSMMSILGLSFAIMGVPLVCPSSSKSGIDPNPLLGPEHDHVHWPDGRPVRCNLLGMVHRLRHFPVHRNLSRGDL